MKACTAASGETVASPAPCFAPGAGAAPLPAPCGAGTAAAAAAAGCAGVFTGSPLAVDSLLPPPPPAATGGLP
eukprot:CAMPEP_0175589726 /NCGR_PEP_ID=MMETSP0096-20121207/51966_1 /TAXON_ID=311494 /ORGANISM="Alexandrium monilatum, Strain CCMP3105" /LENGTH=72 /DNA_ID=CAMNT_0016893769 /DNA_START=105 /DNA_END=319 /DNA_ORIENTATION=+